MMFSFISFKAFNHFLMINKVIESFLFFYIGNFYVYIPPLSHVLESSLKKIKTNMFKTTFTVVNNGK